MDTLDQQNIFQRSIAKTTALVQRVNRLLAVWRKQERSAKSETLANIELFVDQLVFEKGADILKDKEALKLYAIQFAQDEMTRRNEAQEKNEFRQMQGPLAEIDVEDDLTGLPEDADFAKALIKHNPELEKSSK
jgi:hypothetical protein